MKPTLIWFLLALPSHAQDPWKIPMSRWTEADARQVITESPWAKTGGRTKITVRWESARIVEFALQKLGVASIGSHESACYAIAVEGLPADPGAPQAAAFLKANGRAAIEARDVRMERGRVVYLFPRTAELSEPVVFRFPFGVKLGNDVEFRVRSGGTILTRTFSLRAMTYLGERQL